MLSRYRMLREAHHLTQREVSSYLYCSLSCYSNYERGVRPMPVHTIIALADLYNVSLEYLTGRDFVPPKQ